MRRGFVLCFALFGCNGSVTTLDTVTSDGGQGMDSTITAPTNTLQPDQGGGTPVDQATGDDGSPGIYDAGDARVAPIDQPDGMRVTFDAGDAACIWPGAIVNDPPRGVKFAFTNGSSAPRFLVTQGENCHVFTVDDLDVTGFWPPCPLGDVDASTKVDFSSLTPDASVTIPWDGCQIVFQQGVVDCQGYPFIPVGTTCVDTMFTVRKALSSGHHVAKFAVAQGTPNCGTDAAAFSNACTINYGPICNPDAGVPSSILEVPFDLPDWGPDAAPFTVNVAVP
jgi:hypothetical protein